jgi:hypothetical protein
LDYRTGVTSGTFWTLAASVGASHPPQTEFLNPTSSAIRQLSPLLHSSCDAFA